jgi:AcrR family transcriptional regulator
MTTPTAPLSPRKSPRQARAQVTVDAIIEAAAQLLSAGGLPAYTTNAVAIRAGVSIGTLYQYFPNKDALMAALIAREQGRRVAGVRAAFASLPATASLADTMRIIVRAALAPDQASPALARALDHEEARLPVGALVSEQLGGAADIIAAIATRFPADLAHIDPAIAARTLPALLRAAVDSWTSLTPPDLARAESEAVRALLGYLQLPPAAAPR